MFCRKSWSFPSGLSILLLLFFAATAESRSILPAKLIEEQPQTHDFALDLNAKNFDYFFREASIPYAVVEFFAHWCPACRNYKPQYEKVAKHFNGPPNHGIVLMARVDCASKINNKLCERFSISHYPTLFWGPSKKLASGSWKSDEQNEISEIKEWITADLLHNWIVKQLNSHDEADLKYVVEETTHEAFDIILQHKMVKESTRSSLINFLQLLVAHHPSKGCRRGTADLLVNFDDNFRSERQETSSSNSFPSNFKICGAGVPRGSWMFCEGSKNETRGFSCGLWVLLHSISVRITDAESQFAFHGICEFIHNFFPCDECRNHFYEMCSNTTNPIKTSRELSLWLWSAHNKVNERLMKGEASLGAEDPVFPKVIWPSKILCSSCHSSPVGNQFDEKDWNLDDVYTHLKGVYDSRVASPHREAKKAETAPSESAATLPLGAVLAMVLAFGCFGGLACYWRSLQKNRKQKRKVINGR